MATHMTIDFLVDLLARHPVRMVCVDMNTTGAWRGLGIYNLDQADMDLVLKAALTLTENVNGYQPGKGKLRITSACTNRMPIAYWSGENSGRQALWEVRDAAA